MEGFGIQTIRTTTRRLPFKQREVASVLAFIEASGRRGLIIDYHPRMSELGSSWAEVAADGLLILSCPQIQQDVLFVQEQAGRSLFGWRRRVVRSYLGNAMTDDFSPGPTFLSLTAALLSIKNIYRARGVL
ncbi:MAG: hypothetical protein AAGE18_15725 [Pseudomonadota bacterium]